MSLWKDIKKAVLPKKNSERPKAIKIATTKGDGDVVTDPARIASMLVQAADLGIPVEIGFGSKILTYKTKIQTKPWQDKGGNDKSSSDYLMQKEYILIEEIDPSSGNEKILNAPVAILSFPLNNKFNEFHARFDELATVGAQSEDGFKLSFPDTIYRKPQRRNSARVKVHSGSKVSLSVERAAGLTFFTTIYDLSMGGICFLVPTGEGILTEGTDVELTFRWPFEKELVISGTLIKVGYREGKPSAQVCFSIDSYKMTRELGELVVYVERQDLSKRADRKISPGRNYVS